VSAPWDVDVAAVHRGKPQVLTGAAQAGNVTSETNPAVDSLFLFTARPFDADTSLQNNLNRWYDPVVGRWLSEDPVGFEAEDNNLYRYGLGNPVINADPLGLGIEIAADCVLVSESSSGLWRFCHYNCVEDLSIPRKLLPIGGTDDVELPRPVAFGRSKTVFRWCSCPATMRLEKFRYTSHRPPLKDCSKKECLERFEAVAKRMGKSCAGLIVPQAKRACKAVVRAWLEAVKPSCNFCERP